MGLGFYQELKKKTLIYRELYEEDYIYADGFLIIIVGSIKLLQLNILGN